MECVIYLDNTFLEEGCKREREREKNFLPFHPSTLTINFSRFRWKMYELSQKN